jgi:hypothetical protein
MTHEHFLKINQRIIYLQQMEKEFGVDKMGASLQYELKILMQEAQDYADACDQDALQDWENQQDLIDKRDETI